MSFDTVKNTMRLSGLARAIESYDAWGIRRDGDSQLWMSVNGDSQIAPSDWLYHSDLVTEITQSRGAPGGRNIFPSIDA